MNYPKVNPMRLFASLSLLLFAFAIIGCKRETVLSGQVFIVTQGADNIKMGDVEIMVIDRQKARVFFDSKKIEVDNEKGLRRKELNRALAIENAALKDYEWFQSEQPYTTNAEYVKLTTERESLLKQIQKAKQSVNYTPSIPRGGVANPAIGKFYPSEYVSPDLQRFQQKNQISAAIEKASDKAHSLYQQIWEIERAAKEQAKSKRDEAVSKARSAMEYLDAYPDLKTCFHDFQPVVIKSTRTDADGRFNLIYPRDGQYTIYAHAKRSVMDSGEFYYWLVDAPTNSKTVQLNLSNNSLINSDPDQYIKFILHAN